MRYFKYYYFIFFFLIFINCGTKSIAQQIPEILKVRSENDSNYLPDFSFAGYHNGEKEIPANTGVIYNATDYGVIANDGLDDTKALQKAIEALATKEEKVTLQLPKGRIILSDIIYIERSGFVLRGTGTGIHGTELYFPRPLMYVKDPENLKELREYLIEFDKRQREKENNIDLPFSQYAWAGGFIWTKVPGERVKPYLQKYERPYTVLAKIKGGKRGEFSFEVSELNNLNIGDIVELQLFNKSGEEGAIIKDLYKNQDVKIGSHHWNFPGLPLVKQQVEIIAIKGNIVTINSPLTIDVKSSYEAQLVEWKHLKEVGVEHLRLSFPKYPRVAHHVEPGFNGIYLTRVYDGWVKNVVINNADSGILTEEIANVTIKNVTTKGDNYAHYTVMMQATYNVLAEGIKVYNKAVHPLSFNTLATKSVYSNCEVFLDPILDQHSGANHQNLFDNISVHIEPEGKKSYPLFVGGGAGYWKPSHGAYSSFWNIKVNLLSGQDSSEAFLLNGMEDGPFSRVVGISGNQLFKVDYKPDAYIDFVNKTLENIPSLYQYQLKNRMQKK